MLSADAPGILIGIEKCYVNLVYHMLVEVLREMATFIRPQLDLDPGASGFVGLDVKQLSYKVYLDESEFSVVSNRVGLIGNFYLYGGS